MTSQDTRPAPLGLRLCQVAVPALAIPSALGVSTFFSVADGHPEQWTLQGAIAMVGFELTNVGLSILDIRKPELHATVQQVRGWSVATAISMNVIAHYATAAAGSSGFQLIPFVLALVASVPLALLYVKLAALLHAISAGEHAERDALAELRAQLATAREEIAGKARELARVREDGERARETLATSLARVEGDLASLRETFTAEREDLAGQLSTARDAARAAERERARLARELEQAREAAARPRVLSRDDLVREARALADAHGWGASEIGRQLGWPESTVRGWLPASRSVSAAD
jgi:signal transduction histidine kinase